MNLKSKPYRKGIIAYIFDSEGKVLISQNADYKEDEWTFPGGGSEDGETHEETLRRELLEELNMKPSDYTVAGRANQPVKYDFKMRRGDIEIHSYMKNYRGQSKQQFLVEFRGDKKSLILDEKELRKIKWVQVQELEKYLIFSGQLESASETLREFKKI